MEQLSGKVLRTETDIKQTTDPWHGCQVVDDAVVVMRDDAWKLAYKADVA